MDGRLRASLLRVSSMSYPSARLSPVARFCEAFSNACGAYACGACAGTQKTGTTWLYEALIQHAAFAKPSSRPMCALRAFENHHDVHASSLHKVAWQSLSVFVGHGCRCIDGLPLISPCIFRSSCSVYYKEEPKSNGGANAMQTGSFRIETSRQNLASHFLKGAEVLQLVAAATHHSLPARLGLRRD